MADPVFDRLEATIRARRDSPADTSYTASLFARGRPKIAQKLGEEAVETVIAACSGDEASIVPEAADLMFHLAVLLADDFMFGTPGCLRQMVEAYNRTGGNLICAMEVADDATDKYGIISPGATDGRLTEVTALIEKPAKGTSPSNLMIPGRYILQPEVMRILEGQEKGAGGEIQLTDAMAQLIGNQPFHGFTFDGQRYDCGDKAGYIQANLALALARDDIGPVVRAFAKTLLG